MDHIVQTSKFLSLVLFRHNPAKIGLTLDENGWAEVDELIRLSNHYGVRLTRPLLEQVVAENDKKRYAFSEDGKRIRANQGHSVDVDLALSPVQPPETLFHGTAAHFVASIREQGLLSGRRKHVHLSADRATAENVGRRHGRPVVLVIRAIQLAQAGSQFFISDNGVWLTGHVPTEYIEFPERR